MARKLADLREARSARVAEMRSIHDKAANENRDLSAEESTRFEALKTEERSLSGEIGRAESLADMERQLDGAPLDEQGRETRSFSVAKAIQESMNGRLTGREAEVHAELSRGRETRGVMIPTSVLLEHRAVLTTTPAAGPGSNLIGRQMMPLTEHPRPSLVVERMGATVLRDLVGIVDLPRLTESGTVGWIAEHADAPVSDPKFGKVSLSPKTVAGQYEVSRRMLLQASTAIEGVLRNDLGALLRTALDGAALNGTGGVMPTGILNTAGVKKVPNGTTLGDTCADLMAAQELDNITATGGFVTNAKVVNIANKAKDAGGNYLGTDYIFLKQPVVTSNQVPANIGTGSNKSALIYGQWSELVIGYWSGVDILVNPYAESVAKKGGVFIHAFLDADVAVREPKAFAYSEIG